MKKYWYYKIIMICSLMLGGLAIGSLIFYYEKMGMREILTSSGLFVSMMLTSIAMYLEMKKSHIK